MTAAAPVRLFVLMRPFGRGGAVRSTTILLHGLDRRAFEPTVGLLGQRAVAVMAESIGDGTPLLDLGWRRRRDLPAAIWRVARYFDSQRPDVAVGVGTYSNTVLLAARQISRHRPAVIVRETLDPTLLGRGRRLGWLRLAARRLYGGADAVVTPSAGMQRSVSRHFRLPVEAVRHLYNGYDPALDLPVREDAPAPHAWLGGDVPTILYVGRLVDRKGVDHLIEAVGSVRRDTPARLLVLGEGPDRERLEALVRRLGLDDAVRFEGYVASPYAYMRAADVVAVPSLTESFGNTLVEAIRCGAAVVASDCDYGPREILDADSGILVPPADTAALAEAIRSVIRDPGLAARLRSGARDRARLFSPASMVCGYEALFREVAPARTAGSGLERRR